MVGVSARMVEQPYLVSVRFKGEEPISAGESACCPTAIGSGSMSALVSFNDCASTKRLTIAQEKMVSARAWRAGG